MSGDQPPPGWVPPTPPPPGSPPPAQPGPTPGWGTPPPPAATGWGQFTPGAPDGRPSGYPTPGYPTPYPLQPTPAAHKPGAIPLRPLVLGDIFDGAFRIIRYNPKATVGAAVLVSAVAMVLPVVISLITGSTGALRLDANDQGFTDGQVASLAATFGSLLVGLELQSVGLLFVSGMIAHVTSAAAIGRKLTIGEAWAATHGKRWRLLGMAVLLGLAMVLAFAVVAGVLLIGIFGFHSSLAATVVVGIALGLMLVLGYVLFWVRVRALAVPTLMLEPVGVFGALGRAVHLTRRQFWRLFGILLLVALVVGFAGNIVQLPFSLAGNMFLTASSETGYGLTLYVLLTAAGTVLSSAVLQPFQAAVNALLYVDQRIRKEAYDVDLLSQAGILPR